MRVAIRTDASIDIGAGHVARCLALASQLRQAGAECHFLTRGHEGNLINLIKENKFSLSVLPSGGEFIESILDKDLSHAGWVGASWHVDAAQTLQCISMEEPDWLIVDHYGLDERWENLMRKCGCKIMVIDDLANRPHDCNILVDQNLGRLASDYENLVPKESRILVGPQYALLRSEFSMLREMSISRRSKVQLEHVLISMGGVDKSNTTGKLLKVLRNCKLPLSLRITVVLGSQAPWLEEVMQIADNMQIPTKVLVNVRDMALLMCQSDLAFGGAGSTSWERCCLGLPSVICSMASNQASIAQALIESGSALVFDIKSPAEELREIFENIFSDKSRLAKISNSAAAKVDGYGCNRLVEYLFKDMCG